MTTHKKTLILKLEIETYDGREMPSDEDVANEVGGFLSMYCSSMDVLAPSDWFASNVELVNVTDSQKG